MHYLSEKTVLCFEYEKEAATTMQRRKRLYNGILITLILCALWRWRFKWFFSANKFAYYMHRTSETNLHFVLLILRRSNELFIPNWFPLLHFIFIFNFFELNLSTSYIIIDFFSEIDAKSVQNVSFKPSILSKFTEYWFLSSSINEFIAENVKFVIQSMK